jgi:DNA polymerase/3'-5' exonuclease PolX
MLACAIMGKLRMHCDRIAIAGSIRRRKPEVGDIEIVCIPKLGVYIDLFGEPTIRRSSRWVQAVLALDDVIKGNPYNSKHVQVELQDEQHGGIPVDIFTANPSNWGLIYAIRTGSAEYSHRVLECGWVRNGYKSADGMLTKDGLAVPVREEAELFRLAGVPWAEPEARSLHIPNATQSGAASATSAPADCSGGP